MLDKAIVTYVDAARWTVDLRSESSNREYLELQIVGLYSHNKHRGGVVVMPELGAFAFVFTDNNGGQHVFGFTNSNKPEGADDHSSERVPESDDRSFDFRRARPLLEPGDIFLGTADGNQVLVRRGGLIQIEASPLAQTLYIPAGNIIRQYFQQYQAYSPLGEIEWSHPTLVEGETLGGNTQNTPVVVKYSIKRIAQEDVTAGRFSVELRVGKLTSDTLDTETDNEHLFANADASAEDGNWGGKGSAEGAISLVVYSHDTKKTVFTFQVSKEGDLFMRTTGNVHAEIDGEVFVRAKKNVEVAFGAGGDKLVLTEGGDLEAYIKKMVAEALVKLTLKSPLVEINNQGGAFTLMNCSTASLLAGQLVLGGGKGSPAGGTGSPKPVMRDNGTVTALGDHVHPVTLTLSPKECLAIVTVAGTVATNPPLGLGFAKVGGSTDVAVDLTSLLKASPSVGVKSA